MKRTIQLRESDIRRMVMEAVRRLNEDGKDAEYINYNSGTFAPEAFDATDDEKKAQEDAAWNVFNDPAYAQDDSTFPGYECKIEGIDDGRYDCNHNLDKYPFSWPSLYAQGSTGRLKDIIFAQNYRDSISNTTQAGKHNWPGIGLPGEEEFNDDGPLPIDISGSVATRNHFGPKYYTPLDESINRAVKRTIRRRLR